MGEQGLGEWVSKMLPPLYKELSAAGDVMSKTAGERHLVYLWVICNCSLIPVLAEALGTRLDLAGNICFCQDQEKNRESTSGTQDCQNKFLFFAFCTIVHLL